MSRRGRRGRRLPDAGRDAREPDGDGARAATASATTGSSACRCSRSSASVAVLLVPVIWSLLSMDARWSSTTSRPLVSTGDLPAPTTCEALVAEAYERYRARRRAAQRSRVYPALARVPADALRHLRRRHERRRVRRRRRRGRVHDHERRQAVRLRARLPGARARGGARGTLGVNATGLPFNSVAAVERSPDGADEPDGQRRARSRRRASSRARAPRSAGSSLRDGLSRFAGRPLALDEEVYALGLGDEPPQPAASPACSSARGRLDCDPAEATRPLHAAELPRASPRATSR